MIIKPNCKNVQKKRVQNLHLEIPGAIEVNKNNIDQIHGSIPEREGTMGYLLQLYPKVLQ